MKKYVRFTKYGRRLLCAMLIASAVLIGACYGPSHETGGGIESPVQKLQTPAGTAEPQPQTPEAASSAGGIPTMRIPEATLPAGGIPTTQIPEATHATAAPVPATLPPAPTPSVPKDQAEQILSEMSLEEKVGQMFIARCPGENAAEYAEAYHLGGYILFAQDFENRTKAQAAEMIRRYQQAAGIPMLIAVDEEGGTVNRVSRFPQFRQEPFRSPQALFRDGGFDAVRGDAAEKCMLLHELGINVNFAPVADVSLSPEDFIFRRTFGQDADQTAKYIETVVEAMREQKMGSVLKHFPGYGNNADTHTGIVHDSRSYENFVISDFLPFQAGIDAGADMVLVAHNIVDCMPSRYPASISPEVHEILRKILHFNGVIVTDELNMSGVRDFAEDGEVAILAVKAGNDLLCCTNFDTQIPAVLEAVRAGLISEERIDGSVLRILKMKISLGIL